MKVEKANEKFNVVALMLLHLNIVFTIASIRKSETKLV